MVMGAPSVAGVIGDGTRLFLSSRNLNDKNQLYFTAPETDDSTWTPMAITTVMHGAAQMAYDPDHHLVYTSNTQSGAYRMRTQ
jgi:hypothetical protein